MARTAAWAALKQSARVIFATNAVGFVTTTLTQSHKVTDFTGTAAFAASAWATHAAASRAIGAPLLSPSRGLLLAGCATLWAFRLGGYLFWRVLQVGKDARLDQFFQAPGEPLLTGPSNFPLRLAFFWTMQGLWAWVGLLPVTAAHALSRSQPTLGSGLRWGPALVIGLCVFTGGLLMESTADAQKFAFKSDPANKGKFMGPVGLWAYCRHPNYAGEVFVWTGMFLMAGAAVWRAYPWTLASPLFTYVLLRHVSGVTLLERSYDERFGGQADYEAYKASTSLLFPWFPKRNA